MIRNPSFRELGAWLRRRLNEPGLWDAARLDGQAPRPERRRKSPARCGGPPGHVAGCRRIDLYGLRFAEVAGPEVRQAYRELIRKRLEGCPVAYLVGKKEFYGLEFEVSPAVLIPRPDSEHLVMECLKLAKPLSVPRILDIGTGSGNLAIAVAKHLPSSVLTAIDTSAEALSLAQKNATRHGVLERIRFLYSDLFGPLAESELFEIILSNPPYIPTADIPSLPAGVPQLRTASGPRRRPGRFRGLRSPHRPVPPAPRQRRPPAGRNWLAPGSPRPAAFRPVPEYELAATIHDSSGHPARFTGALQIGRMYSSRSAR